MLDDLNTIFNNNNNNNNSNNNNNNKIVNKDNKKIANEDNNKIVNEDNNKIVNENNNMNDNDNDNESDDDYDSDSDDEQYYEIRQINKSFKKIDETKSFEDQIDISKNLPCLSDYWYINYYEDNKETNLWLFKLKFAHVFNDVDVNLFKEILIFNLLVDKLINITSKEENQMLINNIKINEDKIFEEDEFSKFVIKRACKRRDLLDTVKIILQFNETIQPHLT